jgi:hypothetical protein
MGSTEAAFDFPTNPAVPGCYSADIFCWLLCWILRAEIPFAVKEILSGWLLSDNSQHNSQEQPAIHGNDHEKDPTRIARWRPHWIET